MSRTQVLTDEMWARIEPLLPPFKIGSQRDADVYGRLTAADALTDVVELSLHVTTGGAVHAHRATGRWRDRAVRPS